jgi:hypothetical protein
VVLCVDEKPQIQALQRTAPTLPVRPGQPERQTFDYVRHGTTTLFAAQGWPPARSPMPDRPAVSLSTPSPLPLRTIRRLRALGLGRENGVSGIYEYLQTESLELG